MLIAALVLVGSFALAIVGDWEGAMFAMILSWVISNAARLEKLKDR
jgi:hypothetical protein